MANLDDIFSSSTDITAHTNLLLLVKPNPAKKVNKSTHPVMTPVETRSEGKLPATRSPSQLSFPATKYVTCDSIQIINTT